jgi:glucose-6-phosphate dehydrogenase assembly protein OpcA
VSDRVQWRASSPTTIESDLCDLWRDAARDGPVSRALLSNLVVLSGRRSFPAVDEVAKRHPARTILLSYTPGASDARGPEAARVGLMVFGERDVRYGVELIAIHTACAETSIPSIIRRVSQGGVPCSVWWTDASASPLPTDSIAGIGRQLVYDSALWKDVRAGATAASQLLDSHHAPDLADLNWRRLATLRGALVHAIRVESSRDISHAQLRVEHTPQHRVAGALILAWLTAQGSFANAAGLDESRTTDGDLTIVLSADDWSLSAAMTGAKVRVEASGRHPFEVPVAIEPGGDAVASELRTLGYDRQLAAALRVLAASPPQSPQRK